MATFKRRHLVALILFAWALLETNSFDLNEEPEEENEEEEAAAAADAGSVAPASQQSKKQTQAPIRGGHPSAEQLKKLQAMYAKVVKLFEVLRVCDDERFNIDQVNIPQKWADQAKAMMVLAKIGKQRLIKKSDAARFRRIMDNCNQIDARFREREESLLSWESQMSGVNDEDLERFRREQEENPLDDLRSRFTSTPAKGAGAGGPKRQVAMTGQLVRPSDAAPPASGQAEPGNEFKTSPLIGRPRDEGQGPTSFIRFF